MFEIFVKNLFVRISITNYIFALAAYKLGKTHIIFFFFLVVGPLRFYPPYTNGLVVHFHYSASW